MKKFEIFYPSDTGNTIGSIVKADSFLIDEGLVIFYVGHTAVATAPADKVIVMEYDNPE